MPWPLLSDSKTSNAGNRGAVCVKSFTATHGQSHFLSDFALVSQIRRAAQSVTSNIAEGFEREGNREFLQFLSIAKGSVAEVKDQLYTALDEGYISQPEFDSAYRLAEETARIVGGLMSYLRRANVSGSKFKHANSEPNSKP